MIKLEHFLYGKGRGSEEVTLLLKSCCNLGNIENIMWDISRTVKLEAKKKKNLSSFFIYRRDNILFVGKRYFDISNSTYSEIVVFPIDKINKSDINNIGILVGKIMAKLDKDAIKKALTKSDNTITPITLEEQNYGVFNDDEDIDNITQIKILLSAFSTKNLVALVGEIQEETLKNALRYVHPYLLINTNISTFETTFESAEGISFNIAGAENDHKSGYGVRAGRTLFMSSEFTPSTTPSYSNLNMPQLRVFNEFTTRLIFDNNISPTEIQRNKIINLLDSCTKKYLEVKELDKEVEETFKTILNKIKPPMDNISSNKKFDEVTTTFEIWRNSGIECILEVLKPW